ncbi:MAG: TRAP transporter fused permease subunit [Alphaproteobacteria bacterium]|nr:TRAP transporter fused permease subunit [Alphaproteobacteria bacterium]
MAGPELDDTEPAEPALPATEVAKSHGPWAALLAACFLVLLVVWALELPRRIGVPLLPEQLAATCLAIAFILIFLFVRPFRFRGRRIIWPDAVLGAVGAAAALYVAADYSNLVENLYNRRVEAAIVGGLMLVVVLEAMRRTVGTGLAILLAVMIIYALFGHYLPGAIQALSTSADILAGYLLLSPNSLVGRPLVIVSSIVVPFVFFGHVFTTGGGGAFMTDLAGAITGRRRGGAAKVAVLSSGLFGSVSGSVVSNVMTTGAFTIPMMRHAGFPARTAAAIEAVASTGGQLMPPVMGTAAFFMIEFLGVSYTEVVAAAAIPAVLYFVALFIQADLIAARLGIGRPPESGSRNVGAILLDGWHFLVPLATIITALVLFNRSPQWAALTGTVVLIVLARIFAYRGRRATVIEILKSLTSAVYQSLPIIIVGCGAGAVLGTLDASGLSFSFGMYLYNSGPDNLPLLLILTASACIFLGMGLPTSAIYILLATLIAPDLVALGVEPIAAHLFVLYFGMMSMITPPIAFGAFAAASLAGTNFVRTALTAIRFGWSAFILPFVFVLTPALIGYGSPGEIIFVVVCATAGIWLISAAMAGYLGGRLGYTSRIFLLVAGILALYPDFSSLPGIVASVAGVLLGAATFAYEYLGTLRGSSA